MEFGLFHGESSLLPREVSLFFKELGPFHGENSLLFKKVVISLGKLFLFVKVDFRGFSFVLQ
jgi:hypothetical protein